MGYLARAQKPRIYIELVKFCTVMVFPDIKESRPDDVYFTTTVYWPPFFYSSRFLLLKKERPLRVTIKILGIKKKERKIDTHQQSPEVGHDLD